MEPLTVGSLFSGIGGLDLGFERAGFKVAWQVENDAYCTKVLAKHWPDVARYGDVRHVGKHNLTPVDCIIGGFPCQPHSQAGERKASSDERDLWPEFYRIIRELKPRWVVAENVLGLLSSEDGAFFGGILRDLATAGYDARWQVLSAAQFGAPHLRERVILVAHASDIMVRTWSDIPGSMGETPTGTNREGTGTICGPASCGCSPLAYPGGPEWWQSTEGWRNVTDWTNAGWEETASGSELCREELAHASSSGREEWDSSPIAGGQGYAPWRKIAPGSVSGGTWATECGMGRAAHGVSSWLDRYRWPARPGQSQEEWEAPRVTVGKIVNRGARLKGLGNAVVPALAEYVGRCIMAAEVAGKECVA